MLVVRKRGGGWKHCSHVMLARHLTFPLVTSHPHTAKLTNQKTPCCAETTRSESSLIRLAAVRINLFTKCRGEKGWKKTGGQKEKKIYDSSVGKIIKLAVSVKILGTSTGHTRAQCQLTKWRECNETFTLQFKRLIISPMKSYSVFVVIRLRPFVVFSIISPFFLLPVARTSFRPDISARKATTKRVYWRKREAGRERDRRGEELSLRLKSLNGIMASGWTVYFPRLPRMGSFVAKRFQQYPEVEKRSDPASQGELIN